MNKQTPEAAEHDGPSSSLQSERAVNARLRDLVAELKSECAALERREGDHRKRIKELEQDLTNARADASKMLDQISSVQADLSISIRTQSMLQMELSDLREQFRKISESVRRDP